MTFLAPWAGILAAAVAFPVLALLYMLKLRRRPLRVSSTILWEQAVRDLEVNAPWRWLRPSWLLLLHALLVLSLVLAAARPAVPGGDAGTERVIILIDRSASMSAMDGQPASESDREPVSRLSEAKRQALRIAADTRRMGGRQRPWIMVAAFAHDAATVTPFTASAAAIREAVDSVSPTDQPGSLAAAWRMVRAHSAAEESSREEDEGARSRRLTVCLITDHSPGSGPGEGSVVDGPGPRVDVRTIRVGGHRSGPEIPGPEPEAVNTGIVALGAQRDYEDPSMVRVFVRVHTSRQSEGRVLLECRVDGEIVATRRVILSPPVEGQGFAGAGLSGSATFELLQRSAAIVTVSLVGRDLLSADDSASLVLSGAAPPRVLLVSARAPPPFLITALESADLGSLRVVNVPVFEAMVQEQERQRAGDWPFDLVIFDGVEPSRPPGVPTISLGAGMPGSGVRVLPAEEGAAGERALAVRFASWARTHPVMRSVTLDGVAVRPPMRLEIDPEAADAAEGLAVGTGGVGDLILATVDQGGPAAGVRRLFVAFDLMRSNWGPDIGFPVFIFNAIDHLTLRGEAGAGQLFTTAEAAVIPLPRGVVIGSELRLVGPSELSAPVRGGVGMPPSANFGVIQRAGVYRVEGDSAAAIRAAGRMSAIAVNLLDGAETLQGGAAEVGVPTADPQTVVRSAASGEETSSSAGVGVREVWQWLVAAALFLLVLEWVIYSRAARTDAGLGTLAAGGGGGRRGGAR